MNAESPVMIQFEGRKRHNLPEAYLHFSTFSDRMKRVTTDISAIREQNYFNSVYNNVWLTLCMAMDTRAQRRALVALRDNPRKPLSQDMTVREWDAESNARIEENEQYWHSLADVSVYPRYIEVTKTLKAGQYGENTLRKYWDKDTPKRGAKLFDNLIGSAEYIYPYLYNSGLIKNAFMSRGIGQNNINLHNQITKISTEPEVTDPAIVDPSLLHGYVVALQLLLESRDSILSRLLPRIGYFQNINQGRLTVSGTDSHAEVERLATTLEPYRYFQAVLSERIAAVEPELFGEQAELVSDLWKATVYMRTSTAKKMGKIVDVREPLIRFLMRGSYQAAWEKLEEYVAEEPTIIPSFLVKRLGLESDILRELKEEEKARSMEEDEKRSPKAIADSLTPFIDKKLVSVDTPDVWGTFTRHVDLIGSRIYNHFTFKKTDLSQKLQEILGTHIKSRVISAENLEVLIKAYGLALEAQTTQ